MTEGERVRAIRKQNNMTLEKFGERIGMGISSISDIENGRRSLTNQTFLSICREFGVNGTWLHTGEGQMFVEVTQEETISAFIGDVLSGKPDFRRRLISVLARMTPEEWSMLERKAQELVVEMTKADPEGPA